MHPSKQSCDKHRWGFSLYPIKKNILEQAEESYVIPRRSIVARYVPSLPSEAAKKSIYNKR
ncbi:MAG: hypothetical protein PVS3B3_26700 [Ktedonobacteraceae bacterium]